MLLNLLLLYVLINLLGALYLVHGDSDWALSEIRQPVVLTVPLFLLMVAVGFFPISFCVAAYLFLETVADQLVAA